MSSKNKPILKTFPEEGGFLVHRPKSSQNRLILPFRSRHCCRHGIGLQNMKLPKELQDLEINEYEWNNMMQKLQKEVQPLAPSICSLSFYWIITLVGIFCCLLNAEGKYQKKLEEWLEELNSEILSKKNLYAKIQSNEIHAKEYHENISWLAISLNLEDAKILKNEPVVWTPKCCSSEITPMCACCSKIICCFGPKRII